VRIKEYQKIVDEAPVIRPVFKLIRNFMKYGKAFYLMKGEEIILDPDGGFRSVRTGVWYTPFDFTPGYLSFVEYRDINKRNQI
jgi:hypothetical protein